MWIILLILSLYMLFYKFVYINSCVYLELRDAHSKSYIRKHKSANLIDYLLFVRFKKSLSKYIYFSNIIYLFSGIIGLILLILSLCVSISSIVEHYIVFLVILSVFSMLAWITTGMASKVKTYSLFNKILYLGLYITISCYWIVRLVLSVISYFSR